MSENMNDKFFKGFDEMLKKCSVEELARMAIGAGFPISGMLTHENEAVRKIAREKLGLPIE